MSREDEAEADALVWGRAYVQGREAARLSVPGSRCPYGAQPSTARLREAWRKGYADMELEQGEADGDLFRAALDGHEPGL